MEQQRYSNELIHFLSTAFELPPFIRAMVIDQTPDENDVNEAIFNVLFTDFLENIDGLKSIQEDPDRVTSFMEQFLALAVLKHFQPITPWFTASSPATKLPSQFERVDFFRGLPCISVKLFIKPYR